MPIIKRVSDFDEGKTFIVENVFIDYASVFRPNTRYRPEWAVVIRVPEHLRQEFYEVGFRLKQDANGMVTLRAKRYVRLDDGSEMAPPVVVDCENQPWTEQRGLIGNGSRCNVKVRAKYTVYQGVEGLSCFLEGLQVLDHVPYSGGAEFSAAAGSTGGWGQQNFQQQPQQQAPAAPSGRGGQQESADPYAQQPPPQPQQYAPPVQPAPPAAPAAGQQPQYAPPQPQHGNAYNPAVVPPQAAQQPTEYAPPGAQPVPAAVPQGIPTGPPAGGNVSQPQQGALGSFGQPTAPPQEEPQQQTEYVPPGSDYTTGDDIPFSYIDKVIADESL